LELSSYNGWENKFTWLVYLHLSNEQSLAREIVTLVASEPNYCPAGRLVEMWVKTAVTNWYTCFPGRNRRYDESLRLFVWDLVGSALAYADWDVLVALLAGETLSSENLFTWSLYRCILNDSQLQQPVQALMCESSSTYACADALKEWFRVQVDAWIDLPASRRQRSLPISVLVYSLIQNTYTVIYWEHVAEAFRPGY
jgi:hypothetical protein